jgi:hypothetical protein
LGLTAGLPDYDFFNALRLVHHPANIGEASPTFWIFCGAITCAGLLFVPDPFHNGRPTVSRKILSNIFSGIAETVTNGFLIRSLYVHERIPQYHF